MQKRKSTVKWQIHFNYCNSLTCQFHVLYKIAFSRNLEKAVAKSASNCIHQFQYPTATVLIHILFGVQDKIFCKEGRYMHCDCSHPSFPYFFFFFQASDYVVYLHAYFKFVCSCRVCSQKCGCTSCRDHTDVGLASFGEVSCNVMWQSTDLFSVYEGISLAHFLAIC